MTERLRAQVHGTCVALRIGGRWRGALLRGPSGAGKSDLALRLIEGGACLVADDRTEVVAKGKALIATSPAPIAGLIEARGLGIVKLARDQFVARAPIWVLVDLVPTERIARMPELAHERLLGIDLPVLMLAPFEASAPVKLHLALKRIAVA